MKKLDDRMILVLIFALTTLISIKLVAQSDFKKVEIETNLGRITMER